MNDEADTNELTEGNDGAPVTVEQVVAVIDRDSTVSIPVTVYEYEIDVLKEIHGELAVRVVSSSEVEVSNFTAADAFAGLLRKYRQHTAAVKAVYRNTKALARASGLPYRQGDDEAVQYQQSEVVVHEKPKKAAATKKAATK